MCSCGAVLLSKGGGQPHLLLSKRIMLLHTNFTVAHVANLIFNFRICRGTVHARIIFTQNLI